MPHAVLLGDSVFDNAAYVRGGPDVVAQLRGRLPEGWRATLLARDGAVTAHVRTQAANLPADATHLVVSMGGNDALANVDILYRAARSMGESLDHLAAVAGEFAEEYRRTLAAVLREGLPTAVCTIYEGAFPDPDERRRAVTALSVFNDAILRAAFSAGVPVVDLRLVCSEPADYANPIEPSVRGGEKISAAIARLLAEHDFTRRVSAVYA